MDSGTSVGKLELRQAQPEDLPKIYDLYSACRTALKELGTDQWQDGYPQTKVTDEDVLQKSLWLFPDYSGAVVLNKDFDPQHKNIPWHGDERLARFVHRVAIQPEFWGKGLGSILMTEIEKVAKARGAESIRLDTYSANKSNLKFYRKLGYTELSGEVYFQPHIAPFICFEKFL